MSLLSIPAVFPCPRYLEGKGCKYEEIEWKHALCGGKIYIYQDGDAQCVLCGTKSFLQNWRFKCGEISHGSEYVPFTDVASLYNAIGNATKAVAKYYHGNPAGLQRFTRSLIGNLNEKWNFDSICSSSH